MRTGIETPNPSTQFLVTSYSSRSSRTSQTSGSTDVEEMATIIPDMSNCGRICIVGGSETQAGPPFFAGQAALKCGADRVTILTTPSASIPIKCYSASLTVVPYLPEKNSTLSEDFMALVWPLVYDSDAICLGPGLEDGEVIKTAVTKLIVKARSSNIPVVLNSGAHWHLIANGMELLSKSIPAAPVVVILNEDEFTRMWCELHSQGLMSFRDDTSRAIPCPVTSNVLEECPMGEEFSSNKWPSALCIHQTAHVGIALGRNVVVLRIGLIDIIAHGRRTFLFGGRKLRKRCVGHGNVLAGLVTLFLGWQKIKGFSKNPITATKCADFVIRLASLDAFGASTRGVYATDVAQKIPGVMRNLGFFSHVISSGGTSSVAASSSDVSTHSINFKARVPDKDSCSPPDWGDFIQSGQ